jgi:hypothetical protein
MRFALPATALVVLPTIGLFFAVFGGQTAKAPKFPPATDITVTYSTFTAQPVSFFQTNCMRCHGPYGSFYEQESAYNSTELRALLKEMIEGQAQATLDDPHREVQYHLYRAMAARAPFIAISDRGANHVFGETLPGTTITATSAGRPVPVTQFDHTFRIMAPPGGMTITATRDGRSVSLDPSAATYTDMD